MGGTRHNTDDAQVQHNNLSSVGKMVELTLEIVVGQVQSHDGVEIAKLRGDFACERENGTRSKATAV